MPSLDTITMMQTDQGNVSAYIHWVKFSADRKTIQLSTSQGVFPPFAQWETGRSSFVKLWINTIPPGVSNSSVDSQTQAGSTTDPNNPKPLVSWGGVGTYEYTHTDKIFVYAIFISCYASFNLGGSGVANVGSGAMFVTDLANKTFYIITPPAELSNKTFSLPAYDSTIKSPMFLKLNGKINNYDDRGFKFKGYVYIHSSDFPILDNGSSTYKYGWAITSDYTCLILYNNGEYWTIMNEYPSNRQSSLSKANGSLVTNSDKIASASINTINVFSVDTNTARQSGDNRINLPTPSRGAICVIVYAGSNSSKLNNGNVLNINSSTTIDNNSEYTSTNTPYIYTDESYKSSGVVFISDGLTWFIAGWYFGSFWQWGATDKGRYQDIPSKDAYLRLNTWKNQLLYRMASSEAPCLKIVKVNHNNRQCYSVANANDSSVTDVYLNTSNSTSSRHCLEYHDGNQYSCVWLASARVGGNTYYYPIIGYTPN